MRVKEGRLEKKAIALISMRDNWVRDDSGNGEKRSEDIIDWGSEGKERMKKKFCLFLLIETGKSRIYLYIYRPKWQFDCSTIWPTNQ